MPYFSLAVAILAGLVGVFLGFSAFKKFGIMTKGEATFRYLALSSVLAGGAGILIFFSLIVMMSLFDETYVWTVDRILRAIIVPLILGGVITIGSFIQAMMMTRYRNILLKILRRKGNDK
jgi:hypothetical protein